MIYIVIIHKLLLILKFKSESAANAAAA